MSVMFSATESINLLYNITFHKTAAENITLQKCFVFQKLFNIYLGLNAIHIYSAGAAMPLGHA